MKFDGYSKIVFNGDGEVKKITSFTRFGGEVWSVHGGRSVVEPKESVRMQGRAVVVRYLLTKLCSKVYQQTGSGNSKESDDLNQRLTLCRNLTEANKLRNSLISIADFEQLMIDRDAKALLKAAKEEKAEFSQFVDLTRLKGGGVF